MGDLGDGIGRGQVDRTLNRIDLLLERLELLAGRVGWRLRGLLFRLAQLAVIVGVELLEQRDALLVELFELRALRRERRGNLRIGPVSACEPAMTIAGSATPIPLTWAEAGTVKAAASASAAAVVRSFFIRIGFLR